MSRVLTSAAPYRLQSVVFSHGWSDLVPFYVQDSKGHIKVVLRDGGRPVLVDVSPISGGISVRSSGKALSKKAIAALRWMFGLDQDMGTFYQYARSVDRPWIGSQHMGRFLRSQTVFEDLLKLILTTNCSWALTRLMSDRLATMLGGKTADGMLTFPTPEALAKKNEKFYREKIRSGYRSPHIPVIAKAVVQGKLDPESWKTSSLSTEELRKEILKVPGAGPYVAENMLRFLGRYDRLGLDSWARGSLKKLWKMKKTPKDSTIEKKYRTYGEYRGLVLWCDLTKEWKNEELIEKWIRTRPSRV